MAIARSGTIVRMNLALVLHIDAHKCVYMASLLAQIGYLYSILEMLYQFLVSLTLCSPTANSPKRIKMVY